MTKVLDAQVDFSSFVKFDQQLLKLEASTKKASQATIGYQKAGQNLNRAISSTTIGFTATDRILQRTAVGMKSLSADLSKMTFGFEKGALTANKTKTSLAALSTGMNPLQKELKDTVTGANKTTDALEMLEGQARSTGKATAAASSGWSALSGLNPNSTQKGKTSADPNGNFINTIGGRTNRAVLQNTAFQLQDIIVQLEMGIPVTRTLAQQLPQLLGAFGALGAGIGVLVGGALSVLPMLFRDTGAEAEKLAKENLNLTSSYEDLAAAQNDLYLVGAGLQEKYAKSSAELSKFLGLQVDYKKFAFELDKKVSVQGIVGEFSPIRDAVEELEKIANLRKKVVEEAKLVSQAGEQRRRTASGEVAYLPGTAELMLNTAEAGLETLIGKFDDLDPLVKNAARGLEELSSAGAFEFDKIISAGLAVDEALSGMKDVPLELRKDIQELIKVAFKGREEFSAEYIALMTAVSDTSKILEAAAPGAGDLYVQTFSEMEEKAKSSVSVLVAQMAVLQQALLAGSGDVDIITQSITNLSEKINDARIEELNEKVSGLGDAFSDALESLGDTDTSKYSSIKRLIDETENLLMTSQEGLRRSADDTAISTETLSTMLTMLGVRLDESVPADLEDRVAGLGDILQEVLDTEADRAKNSLPNLLAAEEALKEALDASKISAEQYTFALWKINDMMASLQIPSGRQISYAEGRVPETTEDKLARFNRGLDLATNKVDGVQVVAKPVRGGGGSKKTEAELEAERLFKLAEKAKKGYRTVNETLLADINDLKAALAMGFFDEKDKMEMDLYNRALTDLNQQLEYGGLSARFFADTLEDELNNAFSSVINGSKTVEEALLDMISNILMEIANQQFQNNISSPIATGISDWISGAIGGALGGGSTSIGSIRPQARPTTFAANGKIFGGDSNIIPFAKGGIVNRPTLFPFAKGTGLMGEAGPEAIMPLSRGPGGKLGVMAQGAGGGNNVTLIVENNGSNAEAEVQQDSNGAIRLILSAVNRDIQEGGRTYRTIRKTFGVGPMTQGRG